MIWTFPFAFTGLAALAIVSLVVARRSKKRRETLAALFSDALLAQAAPPTSRLLTAVKNALLVSSLIVFTLTLAGPRFGVDETPRETFGRDIFVLLDVSESMLAEDVAPNRLTLAKLNVEDLLNAVVGDRVGLIAFAGSAQVEIPPTNDRALFREILQNVDTTSVALSGTAVGDALRLAVERLGDGSDGAERAIVLIADGEDHSSLPLEAAQRAKSAGIPIYAIAIGDLKGAKIPNFDAAGRRVGYKIFDGTEALSKPDVATMREIAKISGGRFFHADATFEMERVYREEIDALNRALRNETSRPTLKDRYRPFLLVGLLAYVLSRYFPSRFPNKSNRRSQSLVGILLISAFLSQPASAVPFFALENSSQTADLSSRAHPVKKQDVSDNEILPASPLSQETPDRKAVLKNRRSEIEAHNRCVEAAKAGRSEEARALRSILVDAQTPEVAALSRFNEAAETVRQVVANARSAEKNDAASTVNSPANEEASPIDRYRREQTERVKSQRIETDLTENAARLFSDAASTPRIRERSERGAEATRAWLAERRDALNKLEVEERRRLLDDPSVRLDWLREEIRRRVKQQETVAPSDRDAAYYGGLATLGAETEPWDVDASDAANALAARLETPDANAKISTASDKDGAQKIRDALAEFTRIRRDAARQFAAFDGESGAAELRRAETQLAAIQDVATPYPELAIRLADDEAKRAATLVEHSEDKPINDNDFRQNRATLRAAVDEAIRKARQIVASPNAAQNATSDAPNSAEKVLESARIAVESAEELNSLIESTQELAKSDAPDARRSFLESENRLVETLEKIARPLREKNDASSNDRNDPEKNQSQNNQNKQDNNQEQNSSESDDAESRENERSKSNESQDETRQNDASSEEPESENSPQPESDERNEKNDETEADAPPETASQPDETQRLEQTDAQKQADELTRRVRRRQQAAEAERRAVRNALRRRDSVGKDW